MGLLKRQSLKFYICGKLQSQIARHPLDNTVSIAARRTMSAASMMNGSAFLWIHPQFLERNNYGTAQHPSRVR